MSKAEQLIEEVASGSLDEDVSRMIRWLGEPERYPSPKHAADAIAKHLRDAAKKLGQNPRAEVTVGPYGRGSWYVNWTAAVEDPKWDRWALNFVAHDEWTESDHLEVDAADPYTLVISVAK